MRVSKEVRRMIQLNNIYKTFHKGTVNEKKALNGLNLQMKKGDFVTVIGGNGAGKSTMTIKILQKNLSTKEPDT